MMYNAIHLISLLVFVVITLLVGSSNGVPQGGLSMFEISTRPWLYNLTLKYPN